MFGRFHFGGGGRFSRKLNIEFGSRRDDVIEGSDGRDFIWGFRGDDTILGSSGNDYVDGGRGFDVLSFEGSVLDYEISTGRSYLSRFAMITALDGAPTTGRTTTKDVEAVYFAQDDYTYFLNGTNNAVLAGDDLADAVENVELTLTGDTLLANDTEFDGDDIAIVAVDATSSLGATVTLVGGDILYTAGPAFDALAEGETVTDSFTYTVDDGLGGSDTATVTVTVTGTNDDPVLTVASAVTVDENTTAVTAASATDVDGSDITFSLSGTDAALFTIDPATGAIAFISAPDFEAPADANGDNVYDVTVTATDAFGGADSQDVAVTVADVLELPTVDARINEFHYDNEGGDTGEFIEIRAAAGDDVSYLMVELINGSNGAVYDTLAVSDAVMTSDGTYDYYVFALPVNGLQNGAPDGIVLTNGPEVVEFLSYEGTLEATGGAALGLTSTDIGQVEGGTTPVGFSLQRNDDGTWRAPEESTAGAENVAVVVPPQIVINEIMQNPSAVSDSSGEYFELFNAGDEDIDINGWTVSDNDSDSFVIDNGGPLIVSAGGYVVLANNADTATNGGVVADYEYSGMFLSNGADELVLTTPDGLEVDRVEWDGGPGFPDPNGASMELIDPDLDNNVGANWTTAEDSFGDGDLGTPGASNDGPPAFEARINELHYDNAGGDVDEFIEVRVTAGADASDLVVELYNGSNGTLYGSSALSSVTPTSDGTWDYYKINFLGIQNGAPDGLALVNDGAVVEFLSYEGSFTATNSSAVGLTSTDIGVSEASDTPVGFSLQRNEDGTWRAPEENTAGASNDAIELRVNEIHYDNDGADVGEFIEVRVTKGADVSDVSIELYNGNGGGTYGSATSLSTITPSSDDDWDYYVIDYPANGLQNGAPDGVALIQSGEVVEFLSYEGTLTATGGTAVGLTSTDIGVSETNAPIGQSLQRNDDGTWSGPADSTSGAANTGSGGGGGGGATEVLISEIQGQGGDSLLVGQQVSVTAVVTYVASNGFYLQEEDADADADANTSEGIFVFTGGGVAVALGDVMAVTGTVSEFFGATQISSSDSQFVTTSTVLPTPATITLSPDIAQNYEAYEGMRVIVESGTADPLTVITNFNLDRFGQIEISAGSQYQPTQLFDAQTQAAEVAAQQEANANNTLLLDDGVSTQNPTSFDYLPGGAGDNGNGVLDSGDDFGDGGSTIRLGSELEAPVEGVMTYAFGDYQVLVSETLQIDETTNVGARQATPSDVGGDLQIASYNVLNYFTTIDVSGAGTGPSGTLDPRGADTVEEFARQSSKIVDGIIGTGAEVVALQEIENNGTVAISTLVDQLNAEGTAASYAFVDPTGTGDFIGTDAITTGIIYDANAVTLVSSDFIVFEESSAADTYATANAIQTALGISEVGDFQRNRPTVVATFIDNATGQTFTVASSHFKSKGDSGLQDLADAAQAHLDGGGTAITQAQLDALLADPNFDQGDGQGFWNQVRADGAEELNTFVTTEYNGGGVSNFILLGDLNAYAEEDAVQYLDDDAGLVDLIDDYIGQENAYSFVFDGQRGTLDQGLADTTFAANVTGVTEWHINADEPDLINYDESFKDPAFYNDGVYASSDHDPLIIGVEFDTFVLA